MTSKDLGHIWGIVDGKYMNSVLIDNLIKVYNSVTYIDDTWCKFLVKTCPNMAFKFTSFPQSEVLQTAALATWLPHQSLTIVTNCRANRVLFVHCKLKFLGVFLG